MLLFSALLTLLLAGSAQAQGRRCMLSGGALSFGAYNPGQIANLDVMGSVTLQCRGNFTAQLSMSVGTGSGASYATGRVLTSTAGTLLRYNLYTDASHTLVLGDGTNGSARITISGHNTTVTQVLWGRIPARQTAVLPGIYADTLIATVSY